MMMKQRLIVQHHGRQSGYAMLVAITTVGMIATAAVTTMGSTALVTRHDNQTSTALAQAKQALISRAASDANHPGSLPCPDAVTNIAGTNVPNDGIADLLAGANCPSHIGRLPWRTLGLPDLRDADGERLWYLVAPAYQDSPAKIINPGTSGQITGHECIGNQAAQQAWPCDNPKLVAAPWVAVVFSPGRLLSAQLRDSNHANDVAQFLESYNAADPWRLRIAAGEDHNDRIAPVTTEDIFAAVERRVAGELQAVLSKYFTAVAALGHPALPWPATTCSTSNTCNATPIAAPLPATAGGYLPSNDATLNQLMSAQNMAWFDHNHWRTTFTYTIDTNCASGGLTAQCGAAFTVSNVAPFPEGTTVVGGASNTLIAGTRAVLYFTEVAAGSPRTRIAIALQ
jgi:hypothetical protein